ncbi:MAG: histidine phosphatase family protein [Marinobacter sp.]|nr:histidine phosphatase family protein [Marinobacter sp.]
MGLRGLLCLVVGIVFSVSALAAEVDFEPRTASAADIQALHQGGFVIFIRHVATDTRRPDQFPIRLGDCGSQRPLSDRGREQARLLGRYFQQLALPIGEVLVSPMCRAIETAELIFGQDVRVDPSTHYIAGMTDEEKAPILLRTRELLSTPPVSGNRVLVAHGPNIAELMDYFPPEASIVIVNPQGDGAFRYVASILIDDWPALLADLD